MLTNLRRFYEKRLVLPNCIKAWRKTKKNSPSEHLLIKIFTIKSLNENEAWGQGTGHFGLLTWGLCSNVLAEIQMSPVSWGSPRWRILSIAISDVTVMSHCLFQRELEMTGWLTKRLFLLKGLHCLGPPTILLCSLTSFSKQEEGFVLFFNYAFFKNFHNCVFCILLLLTRFSHVRLCATL